MDAAAASLDAVIANEELSRQRPRRELGAATQATIDARARECGFDQHIVKPADPGFLKSLLG